MAINNSFQQQRPFGWSAAVRSTPLQRPGARISPAKAPLAEEKSFVPKLER